MRPPRLPARPGDIVWRWLAGHMRGHIPGGLTLWMGEPASAADYLASVVTVAAAAAVSFLLRPLLTAGAGVLPLVIGVLITAIARGPKPSLLASVLSVLVYDFLFLRPLYSLRIAEPEDLARLVFFGLTSIIVSNLAAFARHQARAADARAAVAEDLYQLGRALAGAAALPDMLAAALRILRAMLHAPVLILLPRDGGFTPHPACGGIADADIAPIDPAEAVLWPGQDTRSDPPPRWLLVPMRTGRGLVGLMAVGREALDNLRLSSPDPFFGTIGDVMAQAIERAAMVEELAQNRLTAERDNLQEGLLASLSHDLRTPLASVMGAAGNLLRQGDDLDAEARRAQASSIQEEARRLDRYIANLLDMTRLESGLADLSRGRIDLTDPIAGALDRGAAMLAGHRVSVTIEPDLPLIAGDEVLLEHVVFNLLENAAKYAPPGTLITIRARRAETDIVIETEDEGPGIPPAELERVFAKFHRIVRPGQAAGGIGLGLTICRGYVRAMGGQITAANRPDRDGALFTVRFPIPPGGDPEDVTS